MHILIWCRFFQILSLDSVESSVLFLIQKNKEIKYEYENLMFHCFMLAIFAFLLSQLISWTCSFRYQLLFKPSWKKIIKMFYNRNLFLKDDVHISIMMMKMIMMMMMMMMIRTENKMQANCNVKPWISILLFQFVVK